MAGVYGNMMIPLKPRGGALPEYQGGGAPYVPGSGMGGRLSGEGARVAAAAVKVAAQADADRGNALAGLAKAADHAVQVGIKAYGDYEAAVAQNAFNHYQQEEMRLRAELNTLEGKNALGTEGVEARLARWRADARERLGAELGDIGHRMFSRAADKLDAQSDAWAVGKVNRENIAFQNTVSEGSILNARNLALENPGDEAALANAVGVIKAEYERMGARSGWDEGYRDARFAEARGKLVGDMISGALAGDDLGAAQTLLRRHGDELGPLKGQFEARIKAKGRELESRARAESERRANETALSGISAVLADTAGMSDEERNAAVFEAIAQEPDRKRRNAMLRVAQDELAFETTRRKAQSAAQGRALFEQAKKEGLSPLDAGKFYNSTDATPEARAYAAELTFGKAAKEGPENREALKNGLMMVDTGQLTTHEQREAYVINYGLTNAQANKLLDYKGRDANVPISEVQKLYTKLGYDELPDGFYEAVLKRLPLGREPTRNEVETAVRDLTAEGEIQGGGLGYGRNMTLFEAGQKGKADTWLPETDAYEDRQLEAQLAEKKIALNEFNRRKLKKLHMGYIDNRPWEK